jgi:hypothetical protein
LTNIALIDGLQGFLDTAFGAPVTAFTTGNIIIGGDGSDIMIGRGCRQRRLSNVNRKSRR